MLSFIGGTGPEGLGLALRFALAGEGIIIGSRSEDRARGAAERLKATLAPRTGNGYCLDRQVQGMENTSAAEVGDIVVVTLPYEAQRETLISLRDHIGDKIVVETVVPVAFQGGKIAAIGVGDGSAAEEAQSLLPQANVIAAFQNLSAETLNDLNEKMDCDVVVCGDREEAKLRVMELVGKIEGLKPINGGKLSNARYVEYLTVLLLNINRIYKGHGSIKITGI